MRIVVNFRNPGDGKITRWNMVTFTYIVVSRYLSGSFSDIWVTIAETVSGTVIPLLSTAAAAAPYDTIGAAYTTTPAALASSCKIYDDPNYGFSDGSCSAGSLADAAGLVGGQNILHTYIMGFMWNPAVTTSHYLYAGVIPNEFPITSTAEATAA